MLNVPFDQIYNDLLVLNVEIISLADRGKGVDWEIPQELEALLIMSDV